MASNRRSSPAASASSATATWRASARPCSRCRRSATTRRATSRRWCTPRSPTHQADEVHRSALRGIADQEHVHLHHVAEAEARLLEFGADLAEHAYDLGRRITVALGAARRRIGLDRVGQLPADEHQRRAGRHLHAARDREVSGLPPDDAVRRRRHRDHRARQGRRDAELHLYLSPCGCPMRDPLRAGRRRKLLSRGAAPVHTRHTQGGGNIPAGRTR